MSHVQCSGEGQILTFPLSEVSASCHKAVLPFTEPSGVRDQGYLSLRDMHAGMPTTCSYKLHHSVPHCQSFITTVLGAPDSLSEVLRAPLLMEQPPPSVCRRARKQQMQAGVKIGCQGHHLSTGQPREKWGNYKCSRAEGLLGRFNKTNFDCPQSSHSWNMHICLLDCKCSRHFPQIIQFFLIPYNFKLFFFSVPTLSHSKNCNNS